MPQNETTPAEPTLESWRVLAIEQGEIIVRMSVALREMIYEATHLSPVKDDGSHWCKISAAALRQARDAIGNE